MAKYFAPLLQKGGGGFGQQPAEKAKQHSGIIVNITAKVGSIGDNGRCCVAGGSENMSLRCVHTPWWYDEFVFHHIFIHPLFLSGLGGWYSYRMSKAALNMATRNLSIELGRNRPKVCLSVIYKHTHRDIHTYI